MTTYRQFTEEKVIDGVLNFRIGQEDKDGLSWSGWKPYTIEALTTALVAERRVSERNMEWGMKYHEIVNRVERALEYPPGTEVYVYPPPPKPAGLAGESEVTK